MAKKPDPTPAQNKAEKPTKKGEETRVSPKKKSPKTISTTEPKFPYSNKPNSLRRFLETIPKKPRPSKVNQDTLKSWGFGDNNDISIIRVLKALDFVSSANEPTSKYADFMVPGSGPKVLGVAIKQIWGPLFEYSHEPFKEPDNTLRNYFNIHSGGSESTISLQIQTFKAACDHADFSVESGIPSFSSSNTESKASSSSTNSEIPTIHIDLHIHLPENKSRRDYECIFEDIGRYILGRDIGEKGRE